MILRFSTDSDLLLDVGVSVGIAFGCDFQQLLFDLRGSLDSLRQLIIFSFWFWSIHFALRLYVGIF